MPLENITGLLRGLTGKMGLGGGAARPEAPGYASELVYADGSQAADIICTAGIWTKVWEYVVPAQELIAVGCGVQGDPHSQGLVDFLLVTVAPADLVGQYRVVAQNARETKRQVIFEKSSAIAHGGGTTDKQLMLLIPESDVKVGEDSKITIEFRATATQTLDFDGATIVIRLPVTIYD